jgi:hypothetical protein
MKQPTLKFRFSTRFLMQYAAIAAVTGCMVGPYDGQVVDGSTIGAAFTFSGVSASPSITITVQVLDQPGTPSQHWVNLATTKTSATPDYYPDGSTPKNAYYQWSVDATPVPTADLAERWPQGGLMHTRAISKGGAPLDLSPLLVADEDQVACFKDNSGGNWSSIAFNCGKDLTYGAAVASNSPTPADAFAGHIVPSYLSFNQYVGPGTPQAQQTETQAYYKKIGAPQTLSSFRQAYGFNTRGVEEIVATYYNDGDLGIGREMHCATAFGAVSCYVRNFAPPNSTNSGVIFGDVDGSLALATGGGAPFATVAMHYVPPGTQDNAVQFIVYGADDQLKSDSAVLDTRHANTDIPGNCLTCHNGAAVYESSKGVTGTPHFLPFDVFNAFKYGNGSYTYESQAESFRKLNVLVATAGASAGIKEYLNGMYSNHLTTPNQPAVNTFVPAAWSGSAVQRKLYTSVVAPYCRTCHLAMTGASNGHLSFDWTTFDEFSVYSSPIGGTVCGSKAMPNAEQTSRHFWNSSARAHLTGALGLVSCDPK